MIGEQKAWQWQRITPRWESQNKYGYGARTSGDKHHLPGRQN